MAKTIKIQAGKQVISIESDDAGVPDVTQGTGPDLLKLQNDAMAEPNAENAEFNAAIDDSPVESEDKTQDIDKANESLFNSIFGFEDGEEAAVTGGDEPEQSDTPVTPPAAEETPAADTGSDDSGSEGAGEVSEADGVTTIDTGDTVITISTSDNAETDTEPAAEETPAEGAENAPAEPEQNTDQAIESFFRNLGL